MHRSYLFSCVLLFFQTISFGQIQQVTFQENGLGSVDRPVLLDIQIDKNVTPRALAIVPLRSTNRPSRLRGKKEDTIDNFYQRLRGRSDRRRRALIKRWKVRLDTIGNWSQFFEGDIDLARRDTSRAFRKYQRHVRRFNRPVMSRWHKVKIIPFENIDWRFENDSSIQVMLGPSLSEDRFQTTFLRPNRRYALWPIYTFNANDLWDGDYELEETRLEYPQHVLTYMKAYAYQDRLTAYGLEMLKYLLKPHAVIDKHSQIPIETLPDSLAGHVGVSREAWDHCRLMWLLPNDDNFTIINFDNSLGKLRYKEECLNRIEACDNLPIELISCLSEYTDNTGTLSDFAMAILLDIVSDRMRQLILAQKEPSQIKSWINNVQKLPLWPDSIYNRQALKDYTFVMAKRNDFGFVLSPVNKSGIAARALKRTLLENPTHFVEKFILSENDKCNDTLTTAQTAKLMSTFQKVYFDWPSSLTTLPIDSVLKELREGRWMHPDSLVASSAPSCFSFHGPNKTGIVYSIEYDCQDYFGLKIDKNRKETLRKIYQSYHQHCVGCWLNESCCDELDSGESREGCSKCSDCPCDASHFLALVQTLDLDSLSRLHQFILIGEYDMSSSTSKSTPTLSSRRDVLKANRKFLLDLRQVLTEESASSSSNIGNDWLLVDTLLAKVEKNLKNVKSRLSVENNKKHWISRASSYLITNCSKSDAKHKCSLASNPWLYDLRLLSKTEQADAYLEGVLKGEYPLGSKVPFRRPSAENGLMILRNLMRSESRADWLLKQLDAFFIKGHSKSDAILETETLLRSIRTRLVAAQQVFESNYLDYNHEIVHLHCDTLIYSKSDFAGQAASRTTFDSKKSQIALSTELLFDKRVQGNFVFDFGLAFAHNNSLDFENKEEIEYLEVLPFFGFQMNFRPLNKDIPFRNYPDMSVFSAHRWSYMLGWSLNPMRIEGQRNDLFAKSSLLTGLGYRLNHAVKLNMGVVIFERIDPNPLMDGTSMGTMPYAGLSIDFSIADQLSKLVEVLKQ